MVCLCLNLHCLKPFVPHNGRQRYCSQKCSAYVRNRRYYATSNGLRKKHEAAGRYFQRNRQKQYDAKKRRIERYAAELLIKGRELLENDAIFRGPNYGVDKMARNMARFEHDYHPWMDRRWRGRSVWVRYPDGKVRLWNPRLSNPVYEMSGNGCLVRIEGLNGGPLDMLLATTRGSAK